MQIQALGLPLHNTKKKVNNSTALFNKESRNDTFTKSNNELGFGSRLKSNNISFGQAMSRAAQRLYERALACKEALNLHEFLLGFQDPTKVTPLGRTVLTEVARIARSEGNHDVARLIIKGILKPFSTERRQRRALENSVVQVVIPGKGRPIITVEQTVPTVSGNKALHAQVIDTANITPKMHGGNRISSYFEQQANQG